MHIAHTWQAFLLQVQYPLELDLAPFMVKRHGPSIMYDLYGVLVHLGHSVHSGHYYCYIKGPNGLWYKMDDTVVSQVGLSDNGLHASAVLLAFGLLRPSGDPHQRSSQPCLHDLPACPASLQVALAHIADTLFFSAEQQPACLADLYFSVE